MAAVKLAPFRNSDRANATAALRWQSPDQERHASLMAAPRAAHYLRCAWFYYGLSSHWKRHADVTSSSET